MDSMRELVALGRHGGGSTITAYSRRLRWAWRLGKFMRGVDRVICCEILGRHEPRTYYQGWGDVPGTLVHWVCGRCHRFRHWGRYADGPSGSAFPRPSDEQLHEWERWGRGLRLMQEREAEARAAVEVPGQCNARWATNRCTRSPGHSGSHGIQMPGFILAPWPNEAEAPTAGNA